jgi:quinolinate synthase
MPALTLENIPALKREVRSLAEERDAVILAHNYQVPEIQQVADFVGDSLGLSRQAAATDSSVIAFCGVHFMAETASILSPDKLVLLPDLEAGCSLADSISADQLRDWKARHPGAVVVMYVNTTAEVKAETDYSGSPPSPAPTSSSSPPRPACCTRSSRRTRARASSPPTAPRSAAT